MKLWRIIALVVVGLAIVGCLAWVCAGRSR